MKPIHEIITDVQHKKNDLYLFGKETRPEDRIKLLAEAFRRVDGKNKNY